MTRDRRLPLPALAGALLFAAACRAPAAAPASSPAPAAPASPPTATVNADTVRADVRFLQDMLVHHAQALAMTALVPSRTGRQDIRLLAERIDVSQQDELAIMRRLLSARGGTEPSGDHAHHGAAQHAAMPGMLTEAELARLRDARGADFDRLFLAFMIRHHEGALAMVRRLLDAPGGTASSELYRLAADVDADQRAEIARMRALLGR